MSTQQASESTITVDRISEKARKQYLPLPPADRQLIAEKVSRPMERSKLRPYQAGNASKQNLLHAHMRDNLILVVKQIGRHFVILAIGTHSETERFADGYGGQTPKKTFGLVEAGLLRPSVTSNGEYQPQAAAEQAAAEQVTAGEDESPAPLTAAAQLVSWIERTAAAAVAQETAAVADAAEESWRLLEDRVEQVADDLGRNSERVEMLTTELGEASQRAAAGTAAVQAALRAELEELRASLTACETRCAAAEARCAQLESQCAQLESRCDQLAARCAQAEGAIDQLSALQRDAAAQAEARSAQFESRSAQLESRSAQLAAALDQLGALQQSTAARLEAALREQSEGARAGHAELHGMLEATAATFARQVSGLQREHNGTAARLDDLTDDLADLASRSWLEWVFPRRQNGLARR